MALLADPPTQQESRPALSLIDCDVHEALTSLNDLLPYLANEWRHYLTGGGYARLPAMPYVVWTGFDQEDLIGEDGRRPNEDIGQMRRLLLDRVKPDYVILQGEVWYINAMPQYDFASAVASAYNDWLVDNWLGKDPRIKGSLQLAAQNVPASVREIDRLGQHPDIVQVMLPTISPGIPWGDEKYYPIWEAVVRNNLRVAFHVSGSTGTSRPPSSAGWPRSFMEMHTVFVQPAQAELINMVCTGLFEKFPRLRIAIVESGFDWVPSVMWRLDSRWRMLRAEVPWLKRRPSDYIRENVRFTTQPAPEPDNPQHLLQVIDMMGSDELLMFSTDFPHWDVDLPNHIFPKGTPPALRRRILVDNAAEFYGFQ